MARKKQKTISIKTSLDDMTLSELKKLAKDEGIDLGGATKKSDILKAIHSAQSKKVKAEEIEIKPKKKVAKKAKKSAAKKTKKPSPKKPSPKKPEAEKDYSKMLVSALRRECTKRGIDCKEAKTKPELIALLSGKELPKKAEKKPVAKKVAKKPKVSPKKGAELDYSKMLVSALRRECKKQGLDCSKAKIKADLIAILSGESKIEVEKKSPAKKAKKSPVKKAKKSPAKKTAKGKKTVTKKAARCDSKDDYVVCDDGSLCNTSTGRCVKDTAANRKKYPASVKLTDGRKIIGSVESIEKIKEILGDLVEEEEETIEIEEKKGRCDAEENYEVCEEDEVCDMEEGKCLKADAKEWKYELLVEDRRIAGKKADVEKLQKLLGGEIIQLRKDEDEEARLKKLLEEGGEEVSELEKEIKKKKERKEVKERKEEKEVKVVEKKKESPKPKESVKVELEKQKIYDTFMRCLETLQ